MNGLFGTFSRLVLGARIARLAPGWNGYGIMARRRPFRAKGPQSAPSTPGRRPRPGSSPRPEKAGPPRREHAGSRHETRSKPHKPAPLTDSGSGKLERLQKVLAHAGLGSRRACEELILQGRVSINGEIIRVLGTRVDPESARVAVDGEPIKQETMVYYAVNKPKGYVSTNFDPSGRPRVVDLLPEIPQRVYTVGRLDEDSTGLLILTNDGELANRLAHPRYGVEKLYRALVAGLPTREMLAKLTEGVWLSDGKVRAKRVRIVGRQGQATMLELVLAEGKKREIRRMLSKLGHKVMSLNRIAVGPISLKGLSVGECRSLSRNEVDLLRKVASGVSVSLPRFFEGGATPPSRDSHRARKVEQAGSGSDADGSPRRRPPRPSRDAHQPHPHADSSQGRPPRRRPATAEGRSASGVDSPPRRRPPLRPLGEPQTNHPHADSGRGRPPRPRPATAGSRNAPSSQRPLDRKKRGGTPPPQPPIKLHVESKQAKTSAQAPPESVRPSRRIIGMEPEQPVGPGLTITGRRKPRRPAIRKRPPPGGVLGKKPGPSLDAGSLEVEDD
jgi:23S rRNA pseudouridine2605 synthase